MEDNQKLIPTVDIRKRAYKFALTLIRYLRKRQWDKISSVLMHQVLRSGVSIGANLVEGKNSASDPEFKRYYEIALRSCNETKYWLCLLRDGCDEENDDLELKTYWQKL